MKSCIVFSVDDSFLEPFQVSLFSLVKHNPWVKLVSFFLIYDNSTLNVVNREYLQSKVFATHGLNFHMIDCSEYLPSNLDGFNYQHVSKATFYRLFIAKMLDNSFDQAVYLDSDILITGDISFLFNHILTKPVSAIKNYAASEEIRLFGDSGGSYFNAGIIVFNLSLIRKKSFQDSYLDLLLTQPNILLYWDQDVLNLVHQNDWEHLPWIYNVTRHMIESFRIVNNNFYRKLNIRNIRIIHFDGPSKPWKYDSSREFADLWRGYYYQLTGRSHFSNSFKYKTFRYFNKFKKSVSFFIKSIIKK